MIHLCPSKDKGVITSIRSKPNMQLAMVVQWVVDLVLENL